VRSVRSRYEIEVLDFCGVQRGLECGLSRRPYGSGREPGIGVRVVGVLGYRLDVRKEESRPTTAQRILYRGIGLQQIPDIKTIVEDTRDGGHFSGPQSFSLNNRRERRHVTF
jgi:hypothetical protein